MPMFIYSKRLAMQAQTTATILAQASLVFLLRPHIHNLQRRILQLDHMARLQRLSVYVIHIMRMENARL
jgi:hypothetical protein